MATRKSKSTTKKNSYKQSASSSKSEKKEPTKSAMSDHWKTYRSLQKKVDAAWQQLQKDVKKKAPTHVVMRSKNELLLLLGECNYMARECMRIAEENKKH